MCLQCFAKLFAAAVEMRSNCADGQVERVGDLFVGTLLLMIEDEDGALDLA